MDICKLRETFVYEPAVGTLRKVRDGRKPYPWRQTSNGGRYLYGYFDGKAEYLHRLIFAYHHGFLPRMVDHINRNTKDNRIENLRPCTVAQNQYNSKRKSNNRSGAKGVVFHSRCKSRPWQAKIVVAGKVVSLGYYATVEEASHAYAAGAARYAKEFARKE